MYLYAIDCLTHAGIDELDLKRLVVQFFEAALKRPSLEDVDNNYINAKGNSYPFSLELNAQEYLR